MHRNTILFMLVLALGTTTMMVKAQQGLPSSNVISAFNDATQEDIRTLGVQNQISAKYYALVHLAQYLSLVNATFLSETIQAGRAAYAGHAVLNQLFPWRFFRHDAYLAPYAAALSADDAKAAQALGQSISGRLIAAHLDDGLANYVKFTPAPANGSPGAYQFTPGQTYALYPQLATTRTFVVPNTSAFDVGPPFALNSPQYNADLAETFKIGAKNSPRTAYQNDTVYFWADGATTSAITGHFNTIAQKVLPATAYLITLAEVFAQANVAAFDASVAGWGNKYSYLFWRPITAIQKGDGIAANAQYVNATWNPELTTPPHPEYPSGHQFSAAAIAGVLSNFLGTDKVNYTIGTEYPGLAPRTFNTLSGAVDDTAVSRIYGGVHFRNSVTLGNKIGYDVAKYVVDNWKKVDFLSGKPVQTASTTPSTPAGRKMI